MKRLLERLHAWRRQRIVKAKPIPDNIWTQAASSLDLLAGMTPGELARLRELTTLLDAAKRFSGAHDLIVTHLMRIAVLAQAAVLVLGRETCGTDPFPGWDTIILYPGAFIARHIWIDEAGVEHHVEYAADGEATDFGPVLISWDDARPGSPDSGTGRNVVAHEFAHKLDFENMRATGYPDLRENMSTRQWSETWQAAFDAFLGSLALPGRAAFDPYAATNPTEFFAVLSEAFFLRPAYLAETFPKVFEQLQTFYGQDPRPRRSRGPNAVRSDPVHGPRRWLNRQT